MSSPLDAKSPDIAGLTEERFLRDVIPEPNTGCWLPIKGIAESGYAVFWWRGVNRGAHRIAYALFKGPIPTGMEIDHLCAVKCCVNPDHLEAVTRVENNKRMQPRRWEGRRGRKHYGSDAWWETHERKPKRKKVGA